MPSINKNFICIIFYFFTVAVCSGVMCSLCSLIKMIVFRKVCDSALVVTFVCKCLGVFTPGFHVCFLLGFLGHVCILLGPRRPHGLPSGSCDPFRLTLCHVISTLSWHTVSSPGHFLGFAVALISPFCGSLPSLTGMTLTCV